MGRSITRAVSEVVDGARAPEWMDPGPAERAWKVEGRRGGPTFREGSFPPTDEVVDHGADVVLGQAYMRFVRIGPSSEAISSFSKENACLTRTLRTFCCIWGGLRRGVCDPMTLSGPI